MADLGTDVDEGALAQLTDLSAPEDAAMSEARNRAGTIRTLPSASVGSLLCWLAATVDARAVVEIGTAAGLTGLWLLRGMPQRGMLTSVDAEGPGHGLAARTFQEAGLSRRVRAISGEPLDILPRLSDASYDLVLVQTPSGDDAAVLDHALRLVRPGGVVVLRRAAAGSHAQLAARRSFVRELADDEHFEVAVLPLDGGIAVATRRREDGRG